MSPLSSVVHGRERGAPQLLKRAIPLHAGSLEYGVDGRRQVAEAAMWSDYVVVLFPYRQSEPGVGQRGEKRFVE